METHHKSTTNSDSMLLATIRNLIQSCFMSHLYSVKTTVAKGCVSSFLALVPECWADSVCEHLMIGYFDANQALLGIDTASSELKAAVILPVRRIVHDALLCNARNVMLAHNHPGGDPRPSQSDLETTRSIARIFAILEIRVVDHLIVARRNMFSFREAGLL